jgi:polyhydroxyalkanoate synthesis regulator protein
MAAALSSARGAETEFRVITIDQLKAMIEEKKDFLLIDARTKE